MISIAFGTMIFGSPPLLDPIGALSVALGTTQCLALFLPTMLVWWWVAQRSNHPKG